MLLVFQGNWQILKAVSVQRMKKPSCGPAAVLQIEARQLPVLGLFTFYFLKLYISSFIFLPEVPLTCTNTLRQILTWKGPILNLVWIETTG